MENLILGAFCLILFVFILTGLPLLGALAIGFCLFFWYGLHKGFSFRQVAAMAWQGVLAVKTIFLVFLLIGMLTALWRASGTIGYIIALAVQFIRPSIFLLMAFWLNCAVSFLLGTRYGSYHGSDHPVPGRDPGHPQPVYRWGHVVRSVFRGPDEPCLHQRFAGQCTDNDRYL